ncbi:hypothetical protein RHECNPAF_1700064 [Rhizobium etli CNPAF512]|nr:hypothetical protein RHECNPAF_1700064 [Rhizobium etli CNPAF512]
MRNSDNATVKLRTGQFCSLRTGEMKSRSPCFEANSQAVVPYPRGGRPCRWPSRPSQVFCLRSGWISDSRDT